MLSLRVLPVLMQQPNKLDGADQEDKKPMVHEMDDIDANPYAYTARERDIQSGLALGLPRTASAYGGSDSDASGDFTQKERNERPQAETSGQLRCAPEHLRT